MSQCFDTCHVLALTNLTLQGPTAPTSTRSLGARARVQHACKCVVHHAPPQVEERTLARFRRRQWPRQSAQARVFLQCLFVFVCVCSCLGVTLSPAAFSVPCRRQLPEVSRECRPQRLCNVRQRCIAHAHALPVPIIGGISCCVLAHFRFQERSFHCSRQVRARTPIASRSSSNSLGRYVVSVGGDDRSMFQWRVVKDFANSDAF